MATSRATTRQKPKTKNTKASKVSSKWETTGGAGVPVDVNKVEFVNRPKSK